MNPSSTALSTRPPTFSTTSEVTLGDDLIANVIDDVMDYGYEDGDVSFSGVNPMMRNNSKLPDDATSTATTTTTTTAATTTATTTAPVITSHTFWRVLVLLYHLSLTVYLVYCATVSMRSLFSSWFSSSHTPQPHLSNLLDFYDYAYIALHPSSLICTGYLICSNPRQPSKAIEHTATAALILQPLLAILLKHHSLSAVAGYLTYAAGYSILAVTFFEKRTELSQMSTPILKQFIYVNLPSAALSCYIGLGYFGVEVVPCFVENNPFRADISEKHYTRLCDDAVNSTYTFQLLFIAAFFLTIYVLPFQSYTTFSAIQFDLHPRHQILVVLFIASCLFAVFLFTSYTEKIEDYESYENGIGASSKRVRSGLNVFVRMILALVIYGAVRPLDSDKHSATSRILPHFTRLKSIIYNFLKRLSYRNPTKLATAWRIVITCFILGCMVTTIVYAVLTLVWPRERQIYVAVYGIVGAIQQPFLAVACSALYNSRPLGHSMYDTYVSFGSLFLNFVLQGSLAIYRSSYLQYPQFFVGGTEQLVIAGVILFVFPLIQESRGYLRTFTPAQVEQYVSMMFRIMCATLPIMIYLSSSAVGCLAGQEAIEHILMESDDCLDYLSSQYIVLSNIMFSVLFQLHTYTTDVISWEDSVTLKGRGSGIHNVVFVLTQSTTSLLTAAVFGQSASEESSEGFCFFALVWIFTAWTFCIFVHTRRVHKLIVIEKIIYDGEEKEDRRRGIYALCRSLRKRVIQAMTKKTEESLDENGEGEGEGEESEGGAATQDATRPKRLAAVCRVALFVVALVPLFLNIAAISLFTYGKRAESFFARSVASFLVLITDTTFATTSLAAVCYVSSDIREGFTNRQHFCLSLPGVCALLSAYSILVLEFIGEENRTQAFIMYTVGPVVLFVITAMTYRAVAKMRHGLNREELNNVVINDVAVVMATCFPPMVIMAAQHVGCIIKDFSDREPDNFAYYNNSCTAVNWTTKPLSVLIFTTGYYNVCFAGLNRKNKVIMSLERVMKFDITPYQYFRITLLAVAAGLAIILYGVGAKRGDDGGEILWIKYFFLIFTSVTGVFLMSEAGHGALMTIREVIDDAMVTGNVGESGERASFRRRVSSLVEMVDVAKLKERFRSGRKKQSAGSQSEAQSTKTKNVSFESCRNSVANVRTMHAQFKLGDSANARSSKVFRSKSVRSKSNMRSFTGGDDGKNEGGDGKGDGENEEEIIEDVDLQHGMDFSPGFI
jgi:hypothetical protein